MVSITALTSATSEQLVQGLTPDDSARMLSALDFAGAAYGDKLSASGQSALDFSIGVAGTLSFMRTDVETRIAGLMFELTLLDTTQAAVI